MSSSTEETKVCESCEQPLSPARLAAVPNATECVPCLESRGDVQRFKMLREPVLKGEQVDFEDLIFTSSSNPYAQDFLDRSQESQFHTHGLKHFVADNARKGNVP